VTCSQVELVFIIDCCFALKLQAIKEVLNRSTILQLVTKFLDKGNVCVDKCSLSDKTAETVTVLVSSIASVTTTE
jgi:hypothetical protein